MPENWIMVWSLLCRPQLDLDIRIDAIPLMSAYFVDENPMACEIKQHGMIVR